MTRAAGLMFAILTAAFVQIAPALAVLPDEVLPDPALEARARTLSRELRCMVCQNQSIDDSDAPLARDLRVLVRERLQAGDGDSQVLDFLTARYGEFVLLKPRFSWRTALLWLAPLLLVVIGGAGVVLVARRAQRPQPAAGGGETAKLSPAEEARVAEILRGRG
jgi:cytochrome c-type biogenesis protein CcmH